ncbi:MAG: hypothetical protein IKK00_05360 [Oscillospiraceae bacterium]|nr:hypothetical protein [Oscillospiraceae bacterium]
MTLHLVLTILAAAIVILLCWMLRGAALLPVRLGKKQRLTLLLHTAADTSALESAVRGLVWLIRDGLPAELIIEDAGLDPDARRAALLLEKQYPFVTYHTASEEPVWENGNT